MRLYLKLEVSQAKSRSPYQGLHTHAKAEGRIPVMSYGNSLKLTFIILAITVIIFCARLLTPLYQGRRVILAEIIPPKTEAVPASFSNSREFLFRLFNTSEKLIAVSAYWQPVNRNVRIFLLKQVNSKPLIQCSFETADGVSTVWLISHDCNGNFYRFKEWNEFTATVRGFSICCTHPGGDGLDYNKEYTTLQLTVSYGTPLPGRHVVRLPIGKALPVISQTNEFPYKFAICVAPMFKTEIYTSKYLVEYLEMHRAFGAQLIIVYLSAEPTLEVMQVLGNYEAWTRFDRKTNFKVIVVHWYLGRYVDPEATWARTQIIAYNDCIYRFAHNAEYFVMSDLDEILVPRPELGYSWTNTISALQKATGDNFPIACSCELRFWYLPLTDITKQSIFYADKTTQPPCVFWRKCFLRSGLVRLFHVHEALEPRNFYHADKIFSVYHYRFCNHTCTPNRGEEVRTNRHLWPLRRRIQSNVQSRLVQMSNDYSLA